MSLGTKNCERQQSAVWCVRGLWGVRDAMIQVYGYVCALTQTCK